MLDKKISMNGEKTFNNALERAAIFCEDSEFDFSFFK